MEYRNLQNQINKKKTFTGSVKNMKKYEGISGKYEGIMTKYRP